mgnify:CR=1 FL=1
MTETLLPAFAALFVTIDPLGMVPVYIALTTGAPAATRRRIAWRAAGLSAVVLALFAVVGRSALEALGISMAAFRVGGGALLFLVAVEMVFERRAARREAQADRARDSGDAGPGEEVAVFPLAVPLIAGPAAITSIMLLMADRAGAPAAQAVVLAVMAVVVAILLGLFLMATWADRFIGPVTATVISRLLGIILAALASQYILDGLKTALG